MLFLKINLLIIVSQRTLNELKHNSYMEVTCVIAMKMISITLISVVRSYPDFLTQLPTMHWGALNCGSYCILSIFSPTFTVIYTIRNLQSASEASIRRTVLICLIAVFTPWRSYQKCKEIASELFWRISTVSVRSGN